MTPFNTWWEAIEDYLSIYPGTSEVQRIAWVGTRLTGTTKAWHLHCRRITRRTGDTWGAYSKASRQTSVTHRKPPMPSRRLANSTIKETSWPTSSSSGP